MSADDLRVNFLLELERAALPLNAFEKGFVDSCLGQFNFSPKQRSVIVKLQVKYEDQLKALAGGQPSLAARAQQAEMAQARDRSRFAVQAGQPLNPVLKRTQQVTRVVAQATR